MEGENTNKKFITLHQASERTGYTPGYLNLLCHKGKLKAEKSGRNWFTTEEWLNEFLATNKTNGKGGGINLAEKNLVAGNIKRAERNEMVGRGEMGETGGIKNIEEVLSERVVEVGALYEKNKSEEKNISENISKIEENVLSGESVISILKEIKEAIATSGLPKNAPSPAPDPQVWARPLPKGEVEFENEKPIQEQKFLFPTTNTKFFFLGFASILIIFFGTAFHSQIENLKNGLGINAGINSENNLALNNHVGKVAGETTDEGISLDKILPTQAETQKGFPYSFGDLILTYSDGLKLREDSISEKEIKFHAIEARNIDTNSITSRTIKDETIRDRDIAKDINLHVKEVITSEGIEISGLAIFKKGIELTSGNINITGDIIPSSDNLYNLGSGTNNWKNLYAKNITAENITAGTYNGNTITTGTGTLTLSSYTLALTGSSNINQNLLTTSTPTFAGLTLNGNLILGANTLTTSNTTLVSNLNADYLDGQHGAYYAPLANITGTINYVSKFTDTHSVGNSIIYDNGTNVGVGTTNPAANLEIAGVSAIPVIAGPNGAASLKIGADNLAFGYSAGYNWLQSYGNLPLFINPLLNNVIFNSGGNAKIGIGLTNPAYRLDITDSATLRGINVANSAAASYGIYSVGTKYGVYGSDGTTSGYLGYDDTYGLYTANNAYIGGALTLGGSQTITGNILPSANDAYTLGDDTHRWSDIYLGAETLHIGTVSGDEGTISYATANNVLTLSAGSATPALAIASSGNIGIGTTGPLGKFHIWQSANNSLYFDVTGGANRIVSIDDTSNVASLTYTGYTHQFFTSSGALNGTEKMRITTAGNVGIGTTGPASVLQVYKSTTDIGTPTTDPADGRYRLLLSNPGLANFAENAIGFTGYYGTVSAFISTQVYYNGENEGTLTFGTRDDGSGGLLERMRINAQGNVGIGTTRPVAVLNIAKSSTAPELIIGDTLVGTGDVSTRVEIGNSASNSNLRIGQDASNFGTMGWIYNATPASGYFSIQTNSNGSNAGNLVLQPSAGNVGIGTTSPGVLLDVRGVDPTIQVKATSGQAIFVADGLGSANYNGLTIKTSGTEKWYLGRDGTDSTDDFILRANAATNVMRIFNSGAVANSLVVNSGNVGIGTTGPGQKLEVENDSAGALTFPIKITNAGDASSNAGLLFQIGTGGNARGKGALVYAGDGTTWNRGDFMFLQNSVTDATNPTLANAVMTIKNSGNVGIGTTGPGSKLETIGEIRASYAAASGGVLQLRGNSDGSSDIQMNAYSGTPLIQFKRSNNAVVMVIENTNGNVGIGTTGPTSKLTVSGSSFIAGRVLSDLMDTTATAQNDGSGISFSGNYNPGSGDSKAYWGWIQGQKESATATNYAGYLSFYTATDGVGAGPNEKVRITSTGNVGIGTTGPGKVLDVVGEIRSYNANGSLSIVGGTYPQLTAYNSAGVKKVQWITIPGSGSSIFDYSAADGGSFKIRNVIDDGAGTVFTINSTGNVGIGTTNPGGPLDVRAATGWQNIQSTTGTNNTWLQIINTGGTMYLGRDSSSGGGLIAGSAAYSTVLDSLGTAPIHFGVNNAIGMTILNGGNVGIGTTAPTQKLDVNGNLEVRGSSGTSANLYLGDASLAVTDVYITPQSSAADVGFNFKSKGAGGLNLNYNGPTGSLNWYGGGTTQTFSVTNAGQGYFAGNVGIGTTGPSFKLHVYDNSTGDNAVYVQQANAAGQASLYLGDGNTGLYRPRSTTDLRFYVGSNDRVTIQSSGNVGIGTTNPGANLEVKGSGAGTVKIGAWVDASYGAISLNGDMSTGANFYSAQGSQTLIINRPSGGDISFRSNNASQMVLLNTGNVGIGTTGPGAALDIQNNSYPTINLKRGADGTTSGASFRTQTSQGTIASPTALAANLALGAFDFNGYDGAAYQGTASIRALVDGTVSSGVLPGRLSFWTGSTNSASLAERMTINNTGNVGIGTTGPGDRLSVMASGTGGITLDTPGTANGENHSITFKGTKTNGTTSLTAGRIIGGYSGTTFSSAYLSFNAITSDGSSVEEIARMTGGNWGIGYSDPGTAKLAINGNVGIGTTGPGAKLEVSGTDNKFQLTYDATHYTSFRTLSGGSLMFTIGGNDRFQMGDAYFQGNTGSSNLPRLNNSPASATNPIFVNSSDTDTGLGMAGDNIASLIAGGVNVLNANASGNVGIGTTSPTAQLTLVKADSSALTDFLINPTAKTSGNLMDLQINGTSKFSIVYNGEASFSNRIYAPSFCNGSSANNALVTLGNTGATVYRNIADANPALIVNQNHGSSTGDILDLQSGGVTKVAFQQSGNVGIGTTAPNTKLQVVGNSEAASGTYYGVIRIDTNSGTNDVGFKLGGLAGAGTAGYGFIQGVHTNTANDLNLSLNPNGGNVGIGTTAPGEKLEVNGNIKLPTGSGIKLYDTSNTRGISMDYNYDSTGSSGSYVNFRPVNSAGGAAGFTMIPNGTNNSTIFMYGTDYIADAGNFYRTSIQTNSSRFQILSQKGGTGVLKPIVLEADGSSNYSQLYLSTTGNVGIGTTAPGAKLQVAGAIALTGGYELRNYGVGGPGATDYEVLDIAHYGASNAIINSTAGGTGTIRPLIFQMGGAEKVRITTTGNVGIGTTNPSQLLDVNGNMNVNGVFYVGASQLSSIYSLVLRRSSGNIGYPDIYGNTNLVISGNGTGTGTMQFATNGLTTPTMYLSTSGNVGIGTTSPGAPLEVNGTIKGSASAYYGVKLTLNNTYASGNSWTFSSAGGGDGQTVGDLYFSKSAIPGTPAMVFTGTGNNVGISTAAPGARLDIKGSTADGSTKILSWQDNNGLGLGTILTNGNVGIGTTNPNVQLHITGTDTTSLRIQPASNTNAQILLNSGTTQEWNIYSKNTAANELVFYSNTSGAVMTIQQSGNVGIGTTGPGRLLSLNAASTPDISLQTAGTERAFIQSTTATLYIKAITGNDIQLQTDGGVNGTKVEITSTGNVGIGTTGPATKLHVEQAASAGVAEEVARFTVADGNTSYISIRNSSTVDNLFVPKIYGFYNGSGGPGLVWQGDAASDSGTVALTTFKSTINGGAVATRPLFDFQNLSSSVMLIDKSGNVGIGTTNPGAKLDIFGDLPLLKISDQTDPTSMVKIGIITPASNRFPGIWFNQATPSDTNYTFLKGGSGALFNAPSGEYIEYRVNNTGYLRLSSTGGLSLGSSYVGTNPGSGSMIISGNVGIGTTSPGAPLQVEKDSIGTAPTTALLLNNATDAADGAVQDSPSLQFAGHTWATGSGTSRDLDWRIYAQPYQSAVGNAYLALGYSNVAKGAAKSFTDSFLFDSPNGIFFVPASGAISMSGNVRIRAAGSGILTLLDNNEASFTRLNMGGSTNSFSAIGRDAVNGFTLQSAAGTATWNDASTAASGTVANRYLWGIATPTLTATNSSVTYTTASSLYIGGAPIAGTNVTITNPAALIVATGNVGIGTTAPGYLLTIAPPSNALASFGLLSSGGAGNSIYFGRSGTYSAEIGFHKSVSDALEFRTGGIDSVSYTRMTILNSGNVGIGTTAPGTALQIGGSGALSFGTTPATTGTIRLPIGGNIVGRNTSNTADRSLLDWGSSVANMLTIGADSINNIVLNPGSGNVGIGTTGPTAQLHLVKADSSALTDFLINPTAKTSGNLIDAQVGGTSKFRADYNGYAYANWFVGSGITGGSNSNVQVSTSNWSSAGTVLRTVEGTMTQSGGQLYGLSIKPTYQQTSTAAATDFLINRTETSVGSGAQYLMDAQVGGASKFVIANNGNVGIGTTNPGAKLNVIGGNLWIGTTSTTGQANDLFTVYGGTGLGTVNGVMYLRRDDAPSNGNTIGYLASFGRINSDTSAWYMGADTNTNAVLASNNSDLRIGADHSGTFYDVLTMKWNGTTNTGNVGIGTTSPTSLLDLYNAATSRISLDVGRTASVAEIFMNYTSGVSTGGLIGQTRVGNEQLYLDSKYSASSIGFKIAGSEKVRIDSNGNVGIGTTAPGTALQIGGSGALSFGTTPATTGTIRLPIGGNIVGRNTSNTADRSLLDWGSSVANMLTIGADSINNIVLNPGSGNVGIGTTNPVDLLHVKGGAAAGAAVSIDAGAAGYNSSLSFRHAGTLKNQINSRATTFDLDFWVNGGNTTAMTILQSTGNVGIGTTGPNELLHIKNSTADSVPRIKLENDAQGYALQVNGGNNDMFQILETTDYNTFLAFRKSTLDLTLGVAGAKTIINGNVGIGTTGPVYLLDVNGESTFRSRLNISGKSGNGLFVQTDPYVGIYPLLMFSSVSSNNAGFSSSGTYIGINSPSGYAGDYVNLLSNGTSLFKINNSGNVGIGTTSPGFKLEVNGTGKFANDLSVLPGNATANLTLQTANGSSSNIYFGNWSANTGAINFNSQLADGLEFRTGGVAVGNTRMVILSGGNVGIGTTSPGSMLEIKNSSNRSVDNYSPLSTDGNGANLVWSTNTTGSAKADVAYFGAVQDGATQQSGRFYWQVGSSGAPGVVMVLDKAGNLGIGNGATTPRAKLDVTGSAFVSGNVGIGTTGPGHKLHVSGTGTQDGIIVNTSGNYPELRLDRGDVAKGYVAINGSGSGYGSTLTDAMIVQSQNALQFVANGSTPTVTINNGNVGIGTTAPGAKLEVQGGVNVGNVGNQGTIKIYSNSASGTGAYGQFQADNTNLGQVNFAGGIGSAATVNNLAVSAHLVDGTDNGHALGSSTNRWNSLWVGTGNGIFQGNVGIGQTVPGSALSVNGGISAGTYSATAAPSGGMIISGNVGIGTTGPLSPLHVVSGGADATTNFLGLFAESGITPEATALSAVNAHKAVVVQGNGAAYFVGRDVTNDIEYMMGISSSGYAFGGATSNHAFSLRTNNTDRLYIKTDGNVGIGTTAPGAKLEVQGGVNVGNVGNQGTIKIYSNSASGTGAYGQFQADNTNLGQVNFAGGIGSAATVNNLAVSAHLVDGTDNGHALGSSTNRWNSLWVGTGNGIFQGNVGIGTTAPETTLHLKGTSGSTTTLRFTSYAENGGGNQNASITYSGAGQNSLDIATGYVSDTNKITISPKGATAMTLLGSGNVGIGTTNPTNNLYVYNTTTLRQGSQSNNLYVGYTGYGNATIRNTATNGGIINLQNDASEGFSFTSFLNTTASNVFTFNARPNSTENLFEIQKSGAAQLTINNSGNVGIGTTAPGEKLEVNGNIKLPTGSGIKLYDTSNTRGISMDYNYDSTGSSGSYVNFRPVNSAGGAAGFTMIPNGTNNSTIFMYGTDYIADAGNFYRTSIQTNSSRFQILSQKGGTGVLKPIVLEADGSSNYSQLYLSTTGNVGIGTTAPGAKLQVAGAIALTGGYELRNYGVGGPGATDYEVLDIAHYGASNAIINSTAGGTGTIRPLIFQMGGAEKVRITTTGNVGIGTATPLGTQHIQGTSAGATIKTLILENHGATEGSGSAIYMGYQANATTPYGIRLKQTGYPSSTYSGDFSIQTHGGSTGDAESDWDTRFFVGRAGNVGIGTTNPGAKLQIDPGTGNSISLMLSEPGYGTAYGYKFAHTVADGRMELMGINNSVDKSIMTFKRDTGNVGIGTTSPTAGLEITPGSGRYGVIINAGDSGSLRWGNGAQGHLSWDTGKATISGLGANDLGLSAGTASVYLKNNTGNVGIGTTTPAHNLDVIGATGVYAGDPGGIQTGSQFYAYKSDADSRFQVETNGTTRVSVFELKNVVDNIYIQGVAYGNGVAGTRFGLNKTKMATLVGVGADNVVFGSASNAPVEFISDSLERMRITGTGNVGIGTTNPQGLLELRKAADVHLKLTQADTVGLDLWHAYSGGSVYFDSLYNNDAGNIYFRTKTSATPVNAMTILGSGNVGIGTTNPVAALQIIGTKSATVGAAPYLGLATDGNVPTFGFRIGTDDNMYLDRRYSSASYNMMSFDRSNGNVGIGTTGPNRKLEVNGSIRMGALITGAGGAVAVYRDANGDLADSTSSIRYKTDVNNMENILPKILELQAVRFKWNNQTSTPGMADFGMIAEEVNNILPDLVTFNPDGTPRGLKYEKMGLFALKGLQEQNGILKQAQNDIFKVQNDVILTNDSIFTQTQNIATLQVQTSENITTLEELKKLMDENNRALEDEISKQTQNFASLQAQMKIIEDQNKAIIDFQIAFDLDKAVFKDASGNINLLEGKITAEDIEALGMVKGQNIEATNNLKGQNLTLGAEVSGAGVIKAGELETKIKTEEAVSGVKIYITPKGSTLGKMLYYEDGEIGIDADGFKFFKVKMDAPALEKDIEFNWLIVK